MSGRSTSSRNWRPGHYRLIVESTAHVQETYSEDVSTPELQKAREDAFSKLQLAAMRDGEEFVNEEFNSVSKSYPDGNAANGFPKQQYDTSLYTENPRSGKSIHDKFLALNAQALQINKVATKTFPGAPKNEFPSGDNDPETRKAKVLFACMHSKDPKDVPDEEKATFNPESDTLENLLTELQSAEKYKNFSIGSGNAASIKLKDGFPLWLQFGPWGTEGTKYADWTIATKQERMKGKNTTATPTVKQMADGKTPPARVATVDRHALLAEQKKQMLKIAHTNELEEINAKASADKSVIEAQSKKRRASFDNQKFHDMVSLYKEAQNRLQGAQDKLVQMYMNTNLSEERMAKMESILNIQIADYQNEVNRLNQIIHSSDVKENTPEPPSSKKSRDGSSAEEGEGMYKRMNQDH